MRKLVILLLLSVVTWAPMAGTSLSQTEVERAVQGWMPAWAPHGTRIAYVSEADGDSEVFVWDLATGNQQKITDNTAIDLGPKWSPDGEWIVIYSSRDGNHELYQIAPDGARLERLTFQPAIDWSPAWTPQGKIVFESYRSGWPDLYLLGLGGATKQLTKDYYRQDQPAVSPDGTTVAFSSFREGNWDIYLIDLASSRQTRLTTSPGIDRYPAWSPDGRKLAFSSFRGDASDIYILDLEKNELVQLTQDRFPDLQPAWSPDGTRIAYASLRENSWKIIIIEMIGSAEEEGALDGRDHQSDQRL